jgi:chlorobactene glucosyltransferase
VTWLIPAAYFVFFALIVLAYARRGPLLADYPPRIDGPLVSIIIPARNESPNIERCVRSVLATAYGAVEVIVVDDRSSDDTAEIVERIAASPDVAGDRLRLIRGAELPPDGDWFGKQWALIQGYRAARGELLLFTDADTTHTPELLPRTVAALERERVDLVTVLPCQEMGSFWERLIQPQVFVVLGSRAGDLRRINRTRTSWNAIANGQYILTTRAAYDAVGTHAAVRHTVVDDLALAQSYVRAGRDIFLVHAVEFMTTRMYRSLREILEGWSKNLALGVPLMMPPLPLLRRLVPWAMWLPALCWVVPPLAWAATGAPVAAATTGISLLIWAEVHRREGAPLWYVPLYPLGAVMVALIMLRSAWRGGRKVEWRGRVYRTDG